MRGVWLWMLTVLPAAAQPVSLSLSQTWSDGPSVTFCLNPRGPDGMPVRTAGAEVTAAAAGRLLKASEVRGFVASGRGVAYLILADVSASIRPAQFEEVRKAMANFAAGLRKVDRMALITFGDEVRVALDFTADQERIRKELDALKPTAPLTKLHLALSRALELGQRADPGLPRRRAIVALTDGKDEGAASASRTCSNRSGRRAFPFTPSVRAGWARRRKNATSTSCGAWLRIRAGISSRPPPLSNSLMRRCGSR